jgi:zinc protease
MIAASFAKIPRPTRKLEAHLHSGAVQDGERMVTVKRVGDIQMASGHV